MTAALGKEYRVVTAELASNEWEWEILRDDRPLDARLRERPFKSQRTAMAAGTVALNEFLRALAQEQSTN
jgi:hypothetical protein